MWRNDAAMRPTTPRFRTPPEWRPDSSDDSSNRSLDRAPSPFAQFSQSDFMFDPFASGWKLPGWKTLDVLIFANLRSTMHVPFDAALHIRSILERRAKPFLLLLAMGTPPRPIHLHAPLGQTACQSIVLMLGAIAKIVGQPECGRDQYGVQHHASPISAGRLNPQFLIAPFSTLLRHGVFIS